MEGSRAPNQYFPCSHLPVSWTCDSVRYVSISANISSTNTCQQFSPSHAGLCWNETMHVKKVNHHSYYNDLIRSIYLWQNLCLLIFISGGGSNQTRIIVIMFLSKKIWIIWDDPLILTCNEAQWLKVRLRGISDLTGTQPLWLRLWLQQTGIGEYSLDQLCMVFAKRNPGQSRTQWIIMLIMFYRVRL